MSRFTGRAAEPPTDEEVISVDVRAFLTFSLYVPGAQKNSARMILVQGSEKMSDTAEKFVGTDAETGGAVEITVSYPK